MTAPSEQDIRDLEDRLTHATRQIDLDALDHLYADDIIFTGVTGALCGKSDLMNEARRGAAEHRTAAQTKHFVASYDKSDVKVISRPETAVTNYRFVVTVEHEGTQTKHAYRTTNVWMKRGARWQVVAGHTSTATA